MTASIVPTAGVFDGREHVLPVRVYFEDTDFTGVVYHASYVRFCERGRSDFLRLARIGHQDLLDRDEPVAFAVSRMTLEFRGPARIDEALQVRTAFDALRGPRFMISQRILRDQAVLLTAAVEVVLITLDGRPRRPPKGLVETLSPWFSTPAP